MLLEDIVDQDLKEDEEYDDDVVALLEEGAALHPAHSAAPQHADASAKHTDVIVYRRYSKAGAIPRLCCHVANALLTC